MTISYNWLCEYLPVQIEPERLSRILTSIGLEVESMEAYENFKGGLAGMVIGEVLTCEQHPNADKLKVTTVNIGQADPIQVVCGAANVAAGQKVVVATVGTTIYPSKGDPLTMKVAKIRGTESYGMICAEDEIGLSDDHSGIMVLPSDLKPGTPASEYFQLYKDTIFEIGLTPNRMDAMSHLGVARDVVAYLIHHDKKDLRVKSPFNNAFKAPGGKASVEVNIENPNGCKRYSGVSISGVTVKESPDWLKNKLLAIGQRPINNIVDITNFILHETGQPLHAFDQQEIKGNAVLVKNLPAETPFLSLDGKERKLHHEDLIICDGNSTPMCIAGVFGGATSGVKETTTDIFLESAWFNPVDIRRTSFRHNLRTEAATRFEKNVDISNTVNVLKRAALMIKEIAGGEIASDIVDIYPGKTEKTKVSLKYHFLKKLSGKNYHPDTVKKILTALGFEIDREGLDDILLTVPFSKPDISMQADIVEEVMRIDGLDNIDIPSSITITPAVEQDGYKHFSKEKIADMLAANGFNEIFTNSITNAAYFEDKDLAEGVKLLNNLSAVHNIMRPSMLETGLEAVAYNLNRKNNNIQFFEFGKTYAQKGIGKYEEYNHLCLYITGNRTDDQWKGKGTSSDVYFLKGLLKNVLASLGIQEIDFNVSTNSKLEASLNIVAQKRTIGEFGIVAKHELNRFDIKQPVYYADLMWDDMMHLVQNKKIRFKELPKQLPVFRDLAVVLPKELEYGTVEKSILAARIQKLTSIKLFDVFESDKIGAGKKSMALSFTFVDEEKTLTDKEIESMMNKIMGVLEKDLNAEIRK